MEYCLMNESHVASIVELEKLCFSDPWSADSIASELVNPLSYWLVAEIDGQVAGYVGSQSVMGEADMMNVAVDERYRGRGIAKNLILNLIERLKSNEVYSLALEVRTSNVAAIGLYNGLGFSQVGRRPNYYSNPKEDALILRKEWEV